MASLFSKLKAKKPPGGQAGALPAYSGDPTFAWDKEKVKQVVREVQPLDWKADKPANHTRFVCLSGQTVSWADYCIRAACVQGLADPGICRGGPQALV